MTILGKRQRKAKRDVKISTDKESLLVDYEVDMPTKIVLSFVGMLAFTYFYFAVVTAWGMIRGG